SALYEADGILEETLVHESGHTSLDPLHASASGWLAAQIADPEFISTYARDNPTREDIAESYLPWLAVRHRPHRISATLSNTIAVTIPNRLAYFDGQNFNMYPIVQEIAVYTGATTNAANERTDNIGIFVFPATVFGSTSVLQTFTIKNRGGNNLTGLALTRSGPAPGDFILGGLGATSLAPNATTTFTVAFSPTATGTRNAFVNVASNDGNENPFRVRVSGVGSITPPRLDNVASLENGGVTFDFTNSPGASFTVIASTNLSLPTDSWTALGRPQRRLPGSFSLRICRRQTARSVFIAFARHRRAHFDVGRVSNIFTIAAPMSPFQQ
ncbi:MAG TPA: choice-of-anchor D domain-containing protein, partial [Verrucomicrobiae bacterium]|nr:choice-of-anchor D domain-containing protein [Verrucomicrobiae bacterium]